MMKAALVALLLVFGLVAVTAPVSAHAGTTDCGDQIADVYIDPQLDHAHACASLFGGGTIIGTP